MIDRSSIPHRPGVYIYKDRAGKVIYVGKAIDLYHRVASYFSRISSSPKTAALVKDIASCETIEVLSELEALILEANLIKKYLPRYNIRLTDDKDYLYIKITKEEFPRIITARKGELKDSLDFFGPFPSSKVIRNTLKSLRRVFPWCTNPHGGRPCFYYHLRLCPGPCVGKVDQKEYRRIIDNFSKFLQGKKNELVESLTYEMEEYSKKQEFEQAQSTKKTLEGIEYMLQSNRAEVYLDNPNFLEDQNKLAVEKLRHDLNLPDLPSRIECYDISNLGGRMAVGSLVVLTHGDIDKRWYRKFKIRLEGKPNDVAQMRQVSGALRELEKAGWNVPVFGLAKRREWLYPPEGDPVKLPRSSLSLLLLQKIRDEAHRFAVTYHRKLREGNKF